MQPAQSCSPGYGAAPLLVLTSFEEGLSALAAAPTLCQVQHRASGREGAAGLDAVMLTCHWDTTVKD